MQETKGQVSLWSFCVFGKENLMEYISIFENYLRENGKAEKTLESYTGDVRKFMGFLSQKGITFDGVLNRFAINSYENHLLQENYEPTTINKKLNSLQSFNIYLIESGKMTDHVINLGRDRIKIAKGSEKQVETFTDDVVDALLFHLETKAKELRDKVVYTEPIG
jgi:integrase/recombinase XerD